MLWWLGLHGAVHYHEKSTDAAQKGLQLNPCSLLLITPSPTPPPFTYHNQLWFYTLRIVFPDHKRPAPKIYPSRQCNRRRSIPHDVGKRDVGSPRKKVKRESVKRCMFPLPHWKSSEGIFRQTRNTTYATWLSEAYRYTYSVLEYQSR